MEKVTIPEMEKVPEKGTGIPKVETGIPKEEKEKEKEKEIPQTKEEKGNHLILNKITHKVNMLKFLT